MHATFAIDDHVIAAVTAGETVTSLSKCSPERLRPITRPERRRDLVLDVLAGDVIGPAILPASGL